jgi:large subunit ribosomal protein L30e
MVEVDITKAIPVVMKTGKTILGASAAITAIIHGNAKMVIMAANTPAKIKNDILHYAKLSEIQCVDFEGSSFDLGFLCGKPFLVSTMVIQDPGESDILNLVGGNV